MGTDGKQKRLNITLPENLINRLKEDQSNVSRYIERLIKEDLESDVSENTEETKTDNEGDIDFDELDRKETERQEKIEAAMFEFLKKYRDETWIEDTLENKEKEDLMEEAESLLLKHPREWSKFVDQFSNSED